MPSSRIRICALAAALWSAALGGCVLPKSLEPGSEDRHAIVTIEDFSDWLEASSIALTPETETLQKQKIAWSYELAYDFVGTESDSPDPLRVVVHSEVAVHPNAPSAVHSANTYGVGLKAGLRKGGASLERVESTLEWGDGTDCFKILKDGRQIGNLFIGHSNKVATYVIVSGLYSSDPALFEALLEPKLRALEHYDPTRTSR
jgi:hypothetical protein